MDSPAPFFFLAPPAIDPSCPFPSLSVRLSRLLDDMECNTMPCTVLAEAAIPFLDPRREHLDLHRALMTVAAAADRSGTANAFHNPCHSREVATLWLNLAAMHCRSGAAPAGLLNARTMLIGATAAFGHDVGHDGIGNERSEIGPDGKAFMRRDPFRLELIAADRVAAALREAGASADEVTSARAIVLATDTVGGYAALECALRLDGAPTEPVHPDLRALADPATRLIAAMLRDADILPSTGLTAADHDHHTALLEAELKLDRHAMGPEGAEYLFGEVLSGRFLSPPAARLQARFHALRALNRLRLADAALHDRDLADVAADLAGLSDEH